MRCSNLIKNLLVIALAASAIPAAASAKPNGYPGENARFKSSDPAVIEQQKADRQKRIERRKQRRQERQRARQERRDSRSN
ncbi:MAG: hypothetical protein AAF496_17275 [Pseudomonadota bacterium]